MSSYQHIFTDGLDKVLSISTWLPYWGGKRSFVYYTDHKVKGFVAQKELPVLAKQGQHYLRDHEKIAELFLEAKKLTGQGKQLHAQVKQVGKNEQQLLPLFTRLSTVLAESYRLYFTTEEFHTTLLHPMKDEKIIKIVGEFRLQFIETCVLATEDLYEVATLIGKQHQLTKSDVQFLNFEEILHLSLAPITSAQLFERKSHFLITKNPDGSLQYVYGETARSNFQKLMPNSSKKVNQLTGLGASKGIICGKVYIVSLADQNVEESMAKMPHGAILVSESTQPKLAIACHKASGIITDEGGILSHAAIIAREMKIPCVVGTHSATEILKNGQEVEIDGKKGTVKLL